MLVDIAGLDTPTGGLDEQVQAAADRRSTGRMLILLVSDGTAHAPLPLGRGWLFSGETLRKRSKLQHHIPGMRPPSNGPIPPPPARSRRGGEEPNGKPFIRVRTKADLFSPKETLQSASPSAAVTGGGGLDELLPQQIAQSIWRPRREPFGPDVGSPAPPRSGAAQRRRSSSP